MINTYDFDAPLYWFFIADDEMFSTPFNQLLINRKSTMTKEEAIDFGLSIGIEKDTILNSIKMIEKKRKEFAKNDIDRYLKDMILNLIYKENKEQMIIDSFPFEALYMNRY